MVLGTNTMLDTASTPIDVSKGGTGNNTLGANEILAGGTTTTGDVQSIPGVSAGYVLTDNGPGVIPSFQPSSGGGTIPQTSVYFSKRVGSDITGDGTLEKPFASIGAALTSVGTTPAYAVTVYGLDNESYDENVTLGSTTSPISLYAPWSIIRPATGDVLTITQEPGETYVNIGEISSPATGVNLINSNVPSPSANTYHNITVATLFSDDGTGIVLNQGQAFVSINCNSVYTGGFTCLAGGPITAVVPNFFQGPISGAVSILTPTASYTNGSPFEISGQLIAGGTFTPGTVTLNNLSSLGSLVLYSSNNAANYAVNITNASFGQGTTFTIPDPASATADIAAVVTPVVAGNVPTFSGTTGVLQDSGVNLDYLQTQDGSKTYALATGAANTYAVTLSPIPASYVTGMVVNFKANAANTGAATLNVNGLGAIAIKKNASAALIANDIANGQMVTVIYDGTNFQMQSILANTTDGGGVNAGLINQLAWYAASGNILSGLATANYGVLNTDGSGVPSISTTPVISQINDTAGKAVATFSGTGSAADYLQFVNGTASSACQISVGGTDANVGLQLKSKGTGLIFLTDSSSNYIAAFNPVASAVNYFVIQGSATGNAINIAPAGSDTNIPLQISTKGTAGVNIYGCQDASMAGNRFVGEVISASVASGSPVSLSNGIAANVTSISLSAGAWRVTGNVGFLVGGTCTAQNAQINTTSATIGDFSLTARLGATALLNNSMVCPQLIVNVSTTTTVYLVAAANFSSSTVTACGQISAMRFR